MGKGTMRWRHKLVMGLTCAMMAGACGSDDSANTEEKQRNGGSDDDSESNGEDNTDTGPAKSYKFLFVPKSKINPVFRPAIDGAQLRATELSSTGKDTVTVEVVGPDISEPEAQAMLLADALSAGGIAGIAISCSSTTNESLTKVLTDAKGAGIPIVAWDSDCGARDAFYSVDNKAAGKLAAQLLAKELGDKGNVAVLTGSLTETNLATRVGGFKEELASHPNITLVETIECDPASQDPLCPPKIDKAMTDHKIDGWFFAAVWMRIMARGDGSTRPELNGQKIPPAQLWQDAAKAGTVKTIAFDSLTEALPFVEDGRIQGLLGQKYWGWGYDTIGLLYDHLAKGKVLAEFIDSGADQVCKANVSEYAASWASNDFSAELPACK